MTVQDAIRDFSSACKRFGWALDQERRFDSRLTEDSPESDFQRLLDMARDRCGISNEVVELSQAVVAALTAHKMEEAALSVSRVAVASQVLVGHVSRWHDLWFECQCHLSNAAIVAVQGSLVDIPNDGQDNDGHKQYASGTQKKISGKNNHAWDANAKKMATRYIAACKKNGKRFNRLEFIIEELLSNADDFPNAREASTINQSLKVHSSKWKPRLDKALGKTTDVE